MAPALQEHAEGREKDGKAGGRCMETLVGASEQRLKEEQRDDVQDLTNKKEEMDFVRPRTWQK